MAWQFMGIELYINLMGICIALKNENDPTESIATINFSRFAELHFFGVRPLQIVRNGNGTSRMWKIPQMPDKKCSGKIYFICVMLCVSIFVH